MVTTVAGSGGASFIDGTGSQTAFSRPMGLAIDASGNVFVAATNEQRVRKINTAGGAHAFAHAVAITC